ncbi:MAG TPA: hypothetical protein VH437_19135 [Terriglobales bacterium]
MRIYKAAVLVVVMLFCGESWSESGHEVAVSLYNDAGVPRKALADAMTIAGRIFSQGGLEIVWTDCSGTERSSSVCERPEGMVIRVIPKSLTFRDTIFGAAFLASDGAGQVADVFYDRVLDLHSTARVDVGRILGQVFSHELGHLLLGVHSHSRIGVMKANWDRNDLEKIARGGSLQFSADESQRMQYRIQESSVIREAVR